MMSPEAAFAVPDEQAFREFTDGEVRVVLELLPLL